MKPTRVLATGMAAGAVSVVLVLSGCAGNKAPALTDPQSEAQQIEMPDYQMTEVEDAGKELVKMGFKVVVVRPAFAVTASEKSTKPGTTIQVEEFRADFEEGAWDHWVTIQNPSAGEPIAIGSTVTLTAGEHLGAQPGKKWLQAHGEPIKRGGDEECFEECHEQDHCTDCHDQIGVKDEKAPKSK